MMVPMNAYANDPDLKAPYWQFRPTSFYVELFPAGTYTADIQYCSWTCERCWSRYGWMGQEPRHVLAPAEVVEKLLKGMHRNAQPMSRISGGEPTLYYDHVKAVIGGLLTQTAGEVMVVPDVTDPAGDPMGIIIETNGNTITTEQIDELDQTWGAEAKRLMLSFGIKATSPEGLAKLTGMAPAAAKAAHERQIKNYLHATLKTEHLVTNVGFINQFTEPEVYAKLQRIVEREKPGAGRNFNTYPHKSYGKTEDWPYVPKRFREQWNTAEGDEETAMLADHEDPRLNRSQKELDGVQKAREAMDDAE